MEKQKKEAEGPLGWEKEKRRLVAHYEEHITRLQDQLVAMTVNNYDLQRQLDRALGHDAPRRDFGADLLS